MKDWNTPVIEEFRENGGKVGGMWEGATLLLLHNTGAKSGEPRVNPVMYRAVDGDYAVFATKAGAQTHPDWYHNLVASPETEIEVGTETIRVKARVAEGEERAAIWASQASEYPQFAGYQQKTDREIPVVILESTA